MFTDMENLVSSSYGATTTPALRGDVRLFLETATYTTLWTNNTTSAVEIDIYDLSYRHD